MSQKRDSMITVKNNSPKIIVNASAIIDEQEI